jgi:hypothetical protein
LVSNFHFILRREISLEGNLFQVDEVPTLPKKRIGMKSESSIGNFTSNSKCPSVLEHNWKG